MPHYERELYQVEPLELVRSGKLFIRTKSGEIKAFIPNFAQNIVIEAIEKRLRANEPVRIRLLKARQLGFSTLFQAIIYAFTSRREGFHSLVIADDEEGSKELFEMNKLYHERLDEMFKPTLRKSNEIALEFEGLKSRIDIDTSRNKNAGRGSTYQIVHKSESSRFAFPKEVNLGVANAVADIPGTMIFDETTANGMNFYYDDVQKSIRHEDGYDFIFIPWVMNPEYKLTTYAVLTLDDEEKSIVSIAQEKYGITVSYAQLSWRRFAIEHKCGGDLDLFRQEYPLTVEEAFIFSGRPRFDVNILRKLKSTCRFPSKTFGLLNVFREPEQRAFYILGVDTSEGLANGDLSSVTVLNAPNFSVDAHYSGRIPPDKLAYYIKEWAEYYNEAMVVVESNNHGLVTLNYLKDIYKKLYYSKHFDRASNEWSQKLGFQTSARTKPVLIGNLDRALRSGLECPVTKIVDSLMNYVIEDDGSTNAAEGRTDDEVISTALAVQGYMEMNEVERVKDKTPTPRYTAQEILEREDKPSYHTAKQFRLR